MKKKYKVTLYTNWFDVPTALSCENMIMDHMRMTRIISVINPTLISNYLRANQIKFPYILGVNLFLGLPFFYLEEK